MRRITIASIILAWSARPAMAVPLCDIIDNLGSRNVVILMPGDYSTLWPDHLDLMTAALRDFRADMGVYYPVKWGSVRTDVAPLADRLANLHRYFLDYPTRTYPTILDYGPGPSVPERIFGTGATVIGIRSPEYRGTSWENIVRDRYERFTSQWYSMRRRPSWARRSRFSPKPPSSARQQWLRRFR